MANAFVTNVRKLITLQQHSGEDTKHEILFGILIQGDPDGCAGFYLVIVAMPLDFGKYQGAFQITKMCLTILRKI